MKTYLGLKRRNHTLFLTVKESLMTPMRSIEVCFSLWCWWWWCSRHSPALKKLDRSYKGCKKEYENFSWSYLRTDESIWLYSPNQCSKSLLFTNPTTYFTERIVVNNDNYTGELKGFIFFLFHLLSYIRDQLCFGHQHFFRCKKQTVSFTHLSFRFWLFPGFIIITLDRTNL